MRTFVTAGLVAAFGILAAPSASAQTTATHNTGTVTFRVFNTGYHGAILGTPAGDAFAFNGLNALFEGQLVVGLSQVQVAGQPYATTAGGQPEWANGTGPTAITPPAPFNQGFETTFTDGGPGNTNPIGLSVTQRTYTSNAAPNDDFAIVQATITNTGSVARSGVHVGIFADWDVATPATSDLGAYDAATRTVYTFGSGAGNTNYYGVTAISHPVSGWSVDLGAGFNPTEGDVYAGLTTPGTVPPAVEDRRSIIGVGPVTLAAGASETFTFAYVAGTNLVDLLANAAAATATIPVANEGGPEERTLRFRSIAPNPAVGATAIGYSLDETAHIRLAVYDVLGRRVATLADGVLPAGHHTAVFDASALPGGTYVARLEADGAQVSRTLAVTR